MAVIDRTVLRLAIFELIGRRRAADGGGHHEAIDLVKTYSTDDSGRFVNGILATIAAEVRPG